MIAATTFGNTAPLALEILGWLALSYVFVSFIEWLFHRYLMHRKRLPKWVYRRSPYLLDVFDAHAVQHHHRYYREFDHEPDPHGRQRNLDIELVDTAAMVLGTAPVFGILFWCSPLGGTIVLAVTVVHNRTWNVVHREMHIPRHGRLSRSWAFRFLAAQHLLHHRQTTKNYNVICPLFDHLLGTRAQPRLRDVRELLRLGYIRPRHPRTPARIQALRDQVARARQRHSSSPITAAARRTCSARRDRTRSCHRSWACCSSSTFHHAPSQVGLVAKAAMVVTVRYDLGERMGKGTQSYGVDEPSKSHQSRLPLQKIMWGAFLLSQILFALIGYFVHHDLDPPDSPPWVILGVLGGVAIADAVAVFAVVPRLLPQGSPAAAMNAFIVRLGLVESIPILGMVGLMLAAPWYSGIPFFLLGLGCHAALFPRDE